MANEVEEAKTRLTEIQNELESVVEQLGEAKACSCTVACVSLNASWKPW